ncbi:MAG TPA: segregation/condensation protein A [Oscillatoriaceae cyanobacterium M33_DOE_052]|uniref:Segregation and condensation protein A n=1 Tax=Planktothricoides sp. SpSt-374 TaxID=2282167 RepID=A0A7C3VF12_9CYAN|nr:segregation/condensation protein A [Oscillatoriaceae cyanobacterium M33_DOE_052]
MSVSLAQDANRQVSEAIALLIDLANKGEIDPWDVQVVEVIDKYLSRLAPSTEPSATEQDAESLRNWREIALSQSGQAFLYAAMLVLLKADSLIRSESPDASSQVEETEFPPDEELEFNPSGGVVKLERQLRRRGVAPAKKKRRVTLQELIEQLQLMSVALSNQPSRATTGGRPYRLPPGGKSTAKTVAALRELASQDNLSDIAAAVEQFLEATWSGLPEGRDWLELDELLDRWHSASCSGPSTSTGVGELPLPYAAKPPDAVGVFWALLHLSAQSKVELSQEEFYQDLKIRSLPATVSSNVSSIA